MVQKETLLSHCLLLLKVKEVVLKSGKVIPAEVLVVGIGKCNAALMSYLLDT